MTITKVNVVAAGRHAGEKILYQPATSRGDGPITGGAGPFDTPCAGKQVGVSCVMG